MFEVYRLAPDQFTNVATHNYAAKSIFIPSMQDFLDQSWPPSFAVAPTGWSRDRWSPETRVSTARIFPAPAVFSTAIS